MPRYSEEAWQEPFPGEEKSASFLRFPWQPYPPYRCLPNWFPVPVPPPSDWTPPSSQNEAIYLGSGTAEVDGAGSVCAVPVESALLAATGQTGFHLPAPATSFGHGGWTHLTSPTPGGTWLSQLYSWDRIQLVRIHSRGQGTPIEDYRNSNAPEPGYEYILYDASGTASRFYERNGRFVPAFGVEAQLIRSGDVFVVIGGPPWAIHQKGGWRYGFTGMSRIPDSPPNAPWGRGHKAWVLFIRDPLGNTWEQVHDRNFPQSVIWRAPNLTLMRFDPDGRVYYSENGEQPNWQLIGQFQPNGPASGRPAYGDAYFVWFEPDNKHIAFKWSSRVVRNTESSLFSEMSLETGVVQNGSFFPQVSQRWLFERSTHWKEAQLYAYLYGEPITETGFLGRLREERRGNHYKTQVDFRYLPSSGAAETQIYREQMPSEAKTSLVHRWNSSTNRFTALEVRRPRLYDGHSSIFYEKEVVALSDQNGKPIERRFYAFADASEPTWREQYRYEYPNNPDVLTGFVDRQGNEYRWEYEEREAQRWHPEIPQSETVLTRTTDPTGVSVSLGYGEIWSDFDVEWRLPNPPVLASSVQLGTNPDRKWRFQYTWSDSLTPTAPNGLLRGFAEPGRRWWKFFYTPASFRQPFQLYMVLDPTGRFTRIINWDSRGRPIRFEAYPDKSGSGWNLNTPLYQEIEYTHFGLVKKVRTGYASYTPQQVEYVWNGLQLQEFIDARGRRARFEYVPGSGELSQIYVGNSLYASLGYDLFGRLGRVAGGNNIGVSYEYGYRDELIAIRHDGDANPERFFYSDCCGQVSRWVRPNGSEVRFDYTPNGWLQEAYIPLGSGQRQRLAYYEYDAAGRLTLAQDALTTTTFTYDTLDADRTGWLQSSTVQFPTATYTFSYTYYLNGEVQTSQLTGPGFASSQRFTYDDAGRLISQSYVQGGTSFSVNYEYDGAGRLTKQTVQVGTDKLETVIAYADHQSVGSVGWFNTYLNNSPIATFTYSYYPDGTVASLRETVGGVSTQWSWDYHPDGSLAYEQSVSIGGRRDYTYDAGGNLQRLPSLPSSVAQYSYNQLRSAGTWTFTYTPNGERASETNNPVAGYQGNWNYAYDIWGNLTHAYWNGQLVYEAQYDAFGNRVWAKVGNQQRYYLYEGDTLVAELDASGNLMAEYVWGLLGPIARVGRASGFPVPTARVQLYVLDGLGHVRALVSRTNTGWQVTDTYVYDSWGNLIGRTGNTVQPFTWNGAYGYEYVPATGLYHVGAREYDPRTARWLQRDPIDAASGDPNLYRYCGNDPINRGDLGGSQYAPKQPANQQSAGQQSKSRLGKIPPQKPVQENDPRFPKPAPYPSVQVFSSPYGMGAYDPNLHIELWVLANYGRIMKTIEQAYAIMEKYFPKGTLGIQGGPADAFRHCVWACLVQREFGDFGYQHVVVDHENPTASWARGRWHETYSPMDLANNEVGKRCALQKGKSCEDACLDALQRGELYVLPRKHWR